MGTGNYVVTGGLVAAVTLVWFAVYPAAALFAVAFTTLFVDRWVGLGYLPHAVSWMPDLVLAALAIRFLAMPPSRRTAFTTRRSVLFALALVGVLSMASMVLNHSSFVEDLVGFRSYFRWPLVFLLVLMVGVGSRTMKRLLVLVVGVALIQAPVAAFQFLQNGGLSDLNSGTLSPGGTSELLMMSMFAMALLMAFAIYGRNPIIWGALGMSLFLAPLYGGARAAVFAIPAFFALLVLSGLASKRDWRAVSAMKVGTVAVACAFVFLLLMAPESTVLGDNYKSFGGVSGVIGVESTGVASRAGRLTSFRESLELVSRSTTTRLVGFGPGSTSDSAFVSGNLNDTVNFVAARTQVSATLLELGYAGPLVLLAVFAALWFTLPRLGDDVDWFWSAVGWATPAIVLVSVVMLFYFAEWTSARATPFLFWMIVAAPFVRLHETQSANRCPSPGHGPPRQSRTAESLQGPPTPGGVTSAKIGDSRPHDSLLSE